MYISHVSMIKYVKVGYSPSNFGYTRIGIGDPYNHSLYMQHCYFEKYDQCLFAHAEVNQNKSMDRCIRQLIQLSEIDNHSYALGQPLTSQVSQTDKILMTETYNLMPGFVGSLLHYRQQVYGEKWKESLEQ